MRRISIRLTLESYSQTERALIFYNHLQVSDDVPRSAKRQLLKDRAYMRVVDHEGYNPRLIEWMTGLSGQKLGNPQLSNYPRYCVSVLDHPEQLWAFAFDQGISYEAQLMLYALAGLPNFCALKDLEKSSTAIWRAAGRTAGRRRLTKALGDVMRVADGGVNGYGLQACVSLIRPLRAAGYPADPVVASLKQRISDREATLDVLEAARDLRAADHTAYTRDEWDQLGDEFWAWQGEALDDPNAYFDDLDELDRLSSLADDFGRALNDVEFSEAYEEVEQSVAEAAERAMEDVDPEDDGGDDDGRGADSRVSPDESKYIDAIFDGLRE